jgi:hypothetical protein
MISQLAASLVAAAVLQMATAATSAGNDPPPAATEHTAPAAQLRQDMRRLWSDHVVWTREYIVAALAEHPSQQASANRLMRNQEDIGSAIAKYYGKPAGDKLTALLKDHISIAVEIVGAAKAGDGETQKKADKRWHEKAEDIAEFLSKANSNLPRKALEEMMDKHLSTTATELTARLERNWEADVAAFDSVESHILMMADALSDGIIKQFPDRFPGGFSGTTH